MTTSVQKDALLSQFAYATADVINAAGGNDNVFGMGGNDTLDGGAGNDKLYGDSGNDTYLFGKGDGQDTIKYDYDTAAGKLNVLQFKSGVLSSEVAAARSISDLVLSIAGTSDKITLERFFYTDDPASNPYNPVQLIKFADGSTLDLAAMMANLIVGNDTAQTLTGYTTDDVINAAGGNDVVYGLGGNDTLDGGAGNDTLFGGTGNDTYLFGKGDGQDFISYDYDTAASKLNVLQFKSGVLPNEVAAAHAGNDLVLSIAGTNDTITLQYYFVSNDPANTPYNPVQLIKFADGSTLDLAAMLANLIVGNDTAQTLTGYATDDVINAAGGNDTVWRRLMAPTGAPSLAPQPAA